MKIIKSSKGTVNQSLSTIDDRIQELSAGTAPEVVNTISQDQIRSGKVVAKTIPEDDMTRVRYLHDLVGWVQYQMEQEDLPANHTNFDTTDDALIITIEDYDNVTKYEVPFEDLKWDFNRIWEDVEYIIGDMI